jgi:WD40 repeat protein
LELTWSENGDYLYVAGDVSLSVFARRDLKTHKHAKSVVHEKEISLVQVLAHKSLLATIGIDGILKTWRASDGALQDECDILHKLKIGKDVTGLRYCPKKGFLAVSCTDGSVMGLNLKVADMLAKAESDVDINEDDFDLDDLEENPEE